MVCDQFYLEEATDVDAIALAALHVAVARDLTDKFGQGPWSSEPSERNVRFAMRRATVFVARDKVGIFATLHLTTRKPWAIDLKNFTKCEKPLYLLAMAVSPERQRAGVGTRCLNEAFRLARAWPADAIRLDAFDYPAGAGGFYAKCGLTEKGRKVYRRCPLIYYEKLL
jgi:GNAT superfamily N-acetyltransferase